MPNIKRNALVGFSAEQMFDLVNNIEKYPDFLPWCGASRVLERTDQTITASLDIAWKGMGKSFTTRNALSTHRIDLSLVDGPFKDLTGVWTFEPLQENACKVGLDLEFTFKGGLMDLLFEPIFNHIANTLVDAFCKQAAAVYG